MNAIRITCLAAALAALAGCNADERGRPVTLEKGGYRGAPDTTLSDATREALKARSTYQRFGAETVAARPAPTEPPEGANVPVDGRTAGQNF